MTNTDQIYDFVKTKRPGLCDDCISKELDIHPRQQVNQICNRLKPEGIVRQQDYCRQCQKLKLVNS